MRAERLNKAQTIALLIVTGVILTFVRWLFILLPASFLFDAVLYGMIGYFLGNHLYYGRWRWGLLLALPAMMAILYFFISATVATTTAAIGLKNIVSFLIIPIGACAGIWLKNNKMVQHK